MSDVASVIERLRRTWLEPPDYQPAVTLLANTLSTSTTSVEFGEFLIPADEQLVAMGRLIEINSELMKVVSYNSISRTATVQRAAYGTTAAAHTINDFVILSPTFPRLSIFEAVADSISTLSPDVFTVDQMNISTVGFNVAPVDDDLALSVLSIWPNNGTHSIGGEIVDFHPLVGGRSVILDENMGGDLWMRYTRRMGRPTAETDTLADLGVEPGWVNIVMAGAAADLYVGRDLPASHTEWVGAALQAENIPVGTRYQIAAGLSSYRDRLLKRASDEMVSEYRPRVRIRSITE